MSATVQTSQAHPRWALCLCISWLPHSGPCPFINIITSKWGRKKKKSNRDVPNGFQLKGSGTRCGVCMPQVPTPGSTSPAMGRVTSWQSLPLAPRQLGDMGLFVTVQEPVPHPACSSEASPKVVVPVTLPVKYSCPGTFPFLKLK